jgi:hypothetical protein
VDLTPNGGALAFGVAIGVLTALSTATGTVIALLGLLFPLVGGSLVTLFKGTEMTAEGRAGVLRVGGLVSLGIIVGLYLGFLTRYVDYRVRSGLVEAEARKPASADSARRPTTNETARVPSSDPRTPPAAAIPSNVSLQGAGSERLETLFQALDEALQDPKLSGQTRGSLMELKMLLESQSFNQAVARAGALLDQEPLKGSTFNAEFLKVFGKPKASATAPAARPPG